MNGVIVKLLKEIKIGDIVLILKNNVIFLYKIKDLLDRRVGVKLVLDYLIDIIDLLELEKFKIY